MQFPEEQLGTKGRMSAWRQNPGWTNLLQTRTVRSMPTVLACTAHI